MTPEEALQAAIKIVGGPAAMSREIDVVRQSIQQWTRCPKKHVEAVEAAVKRAISSIVKPKPVSRYDLRPDLYKKVRK